MTSADEALALFLSSSRVMQDVSRELDHGQDSWKLSLVARVWDPDVKLEREFRTFFVAGELVAITQYDDQLCYRFVAEHPHEIVEALLRGAMRVRPALERLGFASETSAVVVDFAVVPPADGAAKDPGCAADTSGIRGWDVRVIELNPFGLVTGSSLFTWTADRRVLQGGCDPWGDLEEWEGKHPAGEVPRLPHVAEEVVHGVPFRYVAQDPPNITWDRLDGFWPDYRSLAPKELNPSPGRGS